MSKTVLVTGIAGFAGHHFMQHILLNTDWEIIGVDACFPPGDIRRVMEVAGPGTGFDERVVFIKHDLRDEFTEEQLEIIGEPEYIVNFASESHVQRSIDDPLPFVMNNIDLMMTMLEFARSYKPEKFVHISTDEVYGAAPPGFNYLEWTLTLPSNPYSASKAAQESLAISYWRTYGVPIVITNTMNMFGERQDTEKFIPMLIKKINANEKVEIHGSPTYIGSRFYLHARNQADAILYILENLTPIKYQDSEGIIKPSKYNVEGNIELNNLQVALLVAEIMGKKLKYELVDAHAARPGHDRRYALNGNLLRNLGWNPPIEFKASLAKTVEWSLQKENKHWLDSNLTVGVDLIGASYV
jgi:dTDP-glucose 4,6-dehydratase